MENKTENKINTILGNNIEVVLGDGKTYKLGQFDIIDLAYFEDKFGTIDVLFSQQKKFTVLLNVLYCVLRKNHPNIKFEDLDTLLPFAFINEHPEIFEIVTKRVMGMGSGTPKDEAPIKNSPEPAVSQTEVQK
jgi:hypothetical protein